MCYHKNYETGRCAAQALLHMVAVLDKPKHKTLIGFGLSAGCFVTGHGGWNSGIVGFEAISAREMEARFCDHSFRSFMRVRR